MSDSTHFTIRIDKELKMKAQKKANEEFGIGLGTLTKLFLRHFVIQSDKSKIAFYVGDKEFDKRIDELLKSRKVKRALKDLGNSV